MEWIGIAAGVVLVALVVLAFVISPGYKDNPARRNIP
jgi:hypothetical protein